MWNYVNQKLNNFKMLLMILFQSLDGHRNLNIKFYIFHLFQGKSDKNVRK